MIKLLCEGCFEREYWELDVGTYTETLAEKLEMCRGKKPCMQVMLEGNTLTESVLGCDWSLDV